jgi:hypothetical protein
MVYLEVRIVALNCCFFQTREAGEVWHMVLDVHLEVGDVTVDVRPELAAHAAQRAFVLFEDGAPCLVRYLREGQHCVVVLVRWSSRLRRCAFVCSGPCSSIFCEWWVDAFCIDWLHTAGRMV